MTQTDDMADDFELAPPDKLTLHHRRQLSAMLDGELSPDEAKFMLRRLQHDTELADCWERWQVCGDMLRGSGHALLPADFAQRVALAIRAGGSETTEEVAMPQRARSARWIGSAALAASVAVVAFFVARQLPGEVAPATPGTPVDVVATAPGAHSPPAGSPPAVVPATADQATFDQAAAVLAATAAVAEVPRRAAERRSRGQSQRAANRVQQRIAAQEQVRAPAMVATSLEGGQRTPAQQSMPSFAQGNPGTDALADPFATRAASSSRPWPRAILPALVSGGSFAASYGTTTATADFHPFEPRLQPRGTMAGVEGQSDASAAAEAAQPDATDPPR